MRVALVAPIAGPVARDSPSSIETLVALLAEGLAARGHDVTLFATGDSRVGVALHSTYGAGYLEDERLWDQWELHETRNAAAAFRRSADFDVVHSHAYHYALPFAGITPLPTVHTYHIKPPPMIVAAFGEAAGAHVAAVSAYHRSMFAPLRDVAVVPNGIDVDAFEFSPRAGEHLVFLGHLIPRKAPLLAIEVARRTGIPLLLAGQAGDYYDAEVAPLVDGRHVRYIGPVEASARNELLRDAAALVFTSTRAEPFGLVMLEAMACGTPVAALARCAVTEIVVPGVTGCCAADVSALAAAVPDVIRLSRPCVRAAVRGRFHAARMVRRYEALYEGVVAGSIADTRVDLR
jgi:glycosyltransferase involved in cell wall biosynthesis